MKIDVVVADDHRMIRESIVRLLQEHEDIEIVASCPDGLAALQEIRARDPRVAVLDVSMPGLGGGKVLSALAEERVQTHVVILTMHRDPLLTRQLLKAGALAVVLKDDAFDDLVRAIRNAAVGQLFVSPTLAAGVFSGRLRVDAGVTEREAEILASVAQGLTSKQIAQALQLSPKTVENHRTRLMTKLEAHSTADLVRIAVRYGLVD